MRLRATMTFPDLAKVFREQVAKDVTALMKRESRALEKEFEARTLAAGLGQGMAKSWQSRTFPTNGKDVLGPAAFVWSDAPKAMRAFTEGATVVPKQGRYLAIPTQWNRQGGRKGALPKVTPAQMVAAKGQAFVFKSKTRAGVKIWALKVRDGSGRRARQRFGVSAGNLITLNVSGSAVATRQSNQRRLLGQGFVPMFILVPSAVIKKRIDLPPMVAATMTRIRTGLADAINKAEQSLRR